jgi:hypothetical protein
VQDVKGKRITKERQECPRSGAPYQSGAAGYILTNWHSWRAGRRNGGRTTAGSCRSLRGDPAGKVVAVRPLAGCSAGARHVQRCTGDLGRAGRFGEVAWSHRECRGGQGSGITKERSIVMLGGARSIVSLTRTLCKTLASFTPWSSHLTPCTFSVARCAVSYFNHGQRTTDN